ncbi:ABC transporter substrate-binding protein [Sulfitobacter sp. R86518]|uniref:ABC transporter substrate-binding protein n=1 Tax=Sulfitobacter sp. R86518 TaxID=3093858 RepID=UPI0036DB59E9
MTIELDVLPAPPRRGRALDFAGRQVAVFNNRRMFEALVGGQGGPLGLLTDATTSDCGWTWKLYPDPNNTWSDGEPISIDKLALSFENERSIERIANANGIITLHMKRPIACFEAVLTSDLFSVHSNSRSLGPYDLVIDKPGKCLGMKKNAVGDRIWPDGPDIVTFAILRDPARGLRAFERGLIDVTSNPNLPVSAIPKYTGTASLIQGDMLLAGALFFTNSMLMQPNATNFRRAISTALDRPAIAKVCDDTVRPLWSLFELWAPEAAAPAAETNSSEVFFPKRDLTLAYANFPPNDTVVDQLSDQLARALGLNISLRALNYQDFLDCLAAPDVDLVYSLIQPPFDDPTSLGQMFGSDSWLGRTSEAFVSTLQNAQAVLEPLDRLEACMPAQDMLNEVMPLVPILRVRSRCLVSPRAAGFRIERDGVLRPASGERLPT